MSVSGVATDEVELLVWVVVDVLVEMMEDEEDEEEEEDVEPEEPIVVEDEADEEAELEVLEEVEVEAGERIAMTAAAMTKTATIVMAIPIREPEIPRLAEYNAFMMRYAII